MGHEQLTILGGGPAGLAVAYYAQKAGLPFSLYEKSERLGGICRTFVCGRHKYDCGAHRFHDRDPEVTRDVRDLMGDQLRPVRSPSKIFDRGRFVDFPPTPVNLFVTAGLARLGRIGFDFLKARARPRKVVNFYDFAVSEFGETLAEMYLLNYSEKVWGLPGEQLSPSVATRRLSGMTLSALFVELFFPRKKTSHIDGEFLYPIGGYGEITDTIARTLPGKSLRTGYEVVRLDADGGRVRKVYFRDHAALDVEGQVISTLPLNFLVRALGDQAPEAVRQAASHLRFRNLRLFFLQLAQPSVSSNASIYLPDRNLCISRVYEPKNRSREMAPENETALVVEVPFFSGDPIEAVRDEDLYEKVKAELTQIGLIDPSKILHWEHHVARHAYPVYSLDFKPRVELILEFLKKFNNLETVGRNGLFFYSHLHDQMRFAKDLVQRLQSVPEEAEQLPPLAV